jgi:serine/threonine protein kinase
MEAVTGGDLRNTVLNSMSNPKLYGEPDVVRWCHDIARGLHYLHTRSPIVIHRDMKLENVLLDGVLARACCALHDSACVLLTERALTLSRVNAQRNGVQKSRTLVW